MRSCVIAGNYDIKLLIILYACTCVEEYENHLFFRALARKITYALAASFQEYSKSIKEEELRKNNLDGTAKRIFAIDLRKSGETIEDQETEA